MVYRIHIGLKEELYSEIKDAFSDIRILKQVDTGIVKLQNTKIINNTTISEINLVRAQ